MIGSRKLRGLFFDNPRIYTERRSSSDREKLEFHLKKHTSFPGSYSNSSSSEEENSFFNSEASSELLQFFEAHAKAERSSSRCSIL